MRINRQAGELDGESLIEMNNLASGYLCEQGNCIEYPMIYLNGQRLLCWTHYCEEMKKEKGS